MIWFSRGSRGKTLKLPYSQDLAASRISSRVDLEETQSSSSHELWKHLLSSYPLCLFFFFLEYIFLNRFSFENTESVFSNTCPCFVPKQGQHICCLCLLGEKNTKEGTIDFRVCLVLGGWEFAPPHNKAVPARMLPRCPPSCLFWT